MNPCNILDSINASALTMGFEQAWDQISQTVQRWPRSGACDGCAYEEVCMNCAGMLQKDAEPGVWPLAACERTKRFAEHGVYRVPDCK